MLIYQNIYKFFIFFFILWINITNIIIQCFRWRRFQSRHSGEEWLPPQRYSINNAVSSTISTYKEVTLRWLLPQTTKPSTKAMRASGLCFHSWSIGCSGFPRASCTVTSKSSVPNSRLHIIPTGVPSSNDGTFYTKGSHFKPVMSAIHEEKNRRRLSTNKNQSSYLRMVTS